AVRLTAFVFARNSVCQGHSEEAKAQATGGCRALRIMTAAFLLSSALAAFSVFVVSDLVYTLDHYFVHHDKARYLKTHGRHHVRYGGAKTEEHLDAYEVSTYGTAAFMSLMPTSLLSLFTGNPGFALGAALKFLHSLLFHLYQHKWWGPVNVRKLG